MEEPTLVSPLQAKIASGNEKYSGTAYAQIVAEYDGVVREYRRKAQQAVAQFHQIIRKSAAQGQISKEMAEKALAGGASRGVNEMASSAVAQRSGTANTMAGSLATRRNNAGLAAAMAGMQGTSTGQSRCQVRRILQRP